MSSQNIQPLIIGTNGHVASINLETGEENWRTFLKAGGLFSSTTHSDVAVLSHHGLVLAGCCGHLFCLSKDNGEILWHNNLSGLGNNDVSLALEGVAIQYLQKAEKSSS